MWMPIECPRCGAPKLLVHRDALKELGLKIGRDGTKKVLKQGEAVVSVACSMDCAMIPLPNSVNPQPGLSGRIKGR